MRRIESQAAVLLAQSSLIEAEIAARLRIADAALKLEEAEEQLWLRRQVRQLSAVDARHVIDEALTKERMLAHWRAARQHIAGAPLALGAPAVPAASIEVAHSADELEDAALFAFSRMCGLDASAQGPALADFEQQVRRSHSPSEAATILARVRNLLSRIAGSALGQG